MKLSAKAQAALDKVVSKFKTGDLSPIVQIARIHRDPADDCPMAHWSFNNIVMAYVQTGSLDCRGYKQWQKVNRHVVKGSSAAYILAPQTVQKKQNGKPVLEDGKPVTFTYFRTIPVFADDDTEGEPLPTFDYTPDALPPLADIAEQMGIDVQWAPLPPDRLGSATVDGKSIKVGTHDTKTFFHEMAHAIHAKIDTLKGGQDTHRETVAEFTATVLMWMYGYGDRTGNCWQYIKNYSKDPIRAISKALGTVEQVLEILQV
jgi:hypothetical protein